MTDLPAAPGNPGFVQFTASNNGTVLLNAETGEMIYRDPGGIPPGQVFTDTFNYTVKDTDDLSSNVATVTIVINGGNNPPVGEDDTTTVPEDADNVTDCVL